jgi:hypothetical protein
MPAELVRYDGRTPSFTGTVAEFAVVLHPLLGLSGLVAKVTASRAEAERLHAITARDRPPARRALPGPARRPGDATDLRRADARRGGRSRDSPGHRELSYPELSRLEQSFDAALRAIRVEGAARRHEADRRYAAEIRRIDGELRVELGRLAEERRRHRQSFAAARQRLRQVEADRRDIGRAIGEATRMMRGPAGFAEMAALTVPVLSQAMVAVVTRHQDGTAAVLEALRGPRSLDLPVRPGARILEGRADPA